MYERVHMHAQRVARARRDIYGTRVPASRQRVGRDGEKDSLHRGPRDGVRVGFGVRPVAVAERRGLVLPGVLSRHDHAQGGEGRTKVL